MPSTFTEAVEIIDVHDVHGCKCRRPGFDPWVGKIPWRRDRLSTPGFWLGEFHGLYSHGVAKSQKQLSDFHFHGFWASLLAQVVKNLSAMKETWVRSLGWEDPLEKGKAIHSSILAWRIPWTVHGVAKRQT